MSQKDISSDGQESYSWGLVQKYGGNKLKENMSIFLYLRACEKMRYCSYIRMILVLEFDYDGSCLSKAEIPTWLRRRSKSAL